MNLGNTIYDLKFKISSIFIILLLGCIEPFDTNFNLSESIVVIEGKVSNKPEETLVKVQYSVPSGGRNSFFREIENAEVSIIDTKLEKTYLLSTGKGNYLPPNGWHGEVGESYVLNVELTDGNSYISIPQTILPVPEIDTIYQTTERETFDQGNITVATNFIYVDTKDPSGESNYYLWSWENYELLDACKTCLGSFWYPGPTKEGRCVEDNLLVSRGSILDYECEGFCWAIFDSKLLNIQNDQFINGLTLRARKIAEIPYYNRIGGLIEVSQHSIGHEAYDYLSLVISQGQETGGLDDVPPAPLIGNMKSQKSSGSVSSGFFMAMGTTKKKHWIDRSNAKSLNLRPLGLLNGRELRFERANINTDPPRPPKAPCIESKSRTGSEPVGFKTELFINERGERIRD